MGDKNDDSAFSCGGEPSDGRRNPLGRGLAADGTGLCHLCLFAFSLHACCFICFVRRQDCALYGVAGDDRRTPILTSCRTVSPIDLQHAHASRLLACQRLTEYDLGRLHDPSLGQRCGSDIGPMRI